MEPTHEELMAKMFEGAVRKATQEALEGLERQVQEAICIDRIPMETRGAYIQVVRDIIQDEAMEYFAPTP